jgi:hypothetical protein
MFPTYPIEGPRLTVKVKNPKAPAFTREAEEDWGRRRVSPEELQPADTLLHATWDVMREFSTMAKLFSYSGQQLSEKEVKARLQSAMVLAAPISIRF